MKTSLAMSTYCGEKYIIEQLDSIKNQTLKIDEVIISDDCSTDSTADIIEQYILKNTLNNWKLIRNTENKGWMKNFKEVICQTSNEIVFLADQDDIWKPNKVEKMISVMKKNPNIELLASDYDLLYNEKYIRKSQKKSYIEKLKLKKKSFGLVGRGCSFAVRKKLIDELIPYWNDQFAHDGQLWILGYIRKSLYIFHESLFVYRLHDNNVTKRNGISLKRKLNHLYQEECNLILAKKYGEKNNLLDDYEKKIITNSLAYSEKRKKYLLEKKWFDFFGNIRYIMYYRTFKTVFGDVIAKLKSK